jgi:hypothetical protein
LFRALLEITEDYNENKDGTNKAIAFNGGTGRALGSEIVEDYSEEAKF